MTVKYSLFCSTRFNFNVLFACVNTLFKSTSTPLDILTSQPSRYINVSCETMVSGQLVAVMSSYVCGPDCLGIEPRRLLLRCRWELVWMRCCVAGKPVENSIYQAGRLGLDALQPRPQTETQSCKNKGGHFIDQQLYILDDTLLNLPYA